ncbi:MAG: HD domain-containing protein [Alphaproteobacteria bacterium]|jgi:guanosine-3',5'-bis(diphosphate) 3'-pyrophosphohydrolase|nr:HD domain-containing protein [Alphaproteobacteria bacterium]
MNELKITSDRIKQALALATEAHKGAFRKAGDGKTPYVSHPIEVASIIQQYHPENENAIIGALLHDTVEDTDVTFEDIEEMFGVEVYSIIKEVTDDESDLQHLPKDELKKVRRQRQVDNLKNISFEAQLIRLGDKISNVSTIASVNKGPEWQQEYLNFVKDVYEELKDINSPMTGLLKDKISVVSTELKVKKNLNKAEGLEYGG